jgi:hypothetical protein
LNWIELTQAGPRPDFASKVTYENTRTGCSRHSTGAGSGQSLSAVLPAAQEKVAPRDRALLQELCYGTLRWLPRLDAAVSEMMDKPLKNKSRIFDYLILVGLYQLIYTRIPAHAAVAETVNAVKLLKGLCAASSTACCATSSAAPKSFCCASTASQHPPRPGVAQAPASGLSG